MTILKKQKYRSEQGTEELYTKGKISGNFLLEHGIAYTLFGFIKWKWVTHCTDNCKKEFKFGKL